MKVRWTRTATEDLNRAYAFIARENPSAADQIEDRVLEAAQSLDMFANRGRPGRLSDTRELVVAHTPYLIVYADEGAETMILRAVHGHQLWPSSDGD